MNRLYPFRQSSFTLVDGLSITNQTHHKSPVRLSVHTRNQIFRLRIWEIANALLLAHKPLQLLLRPGPLRLVKYGNMFHGNISLVRMTLKISFYGNYLFSFHLSPFQIQVTVMMNHLDEGLHFTLCLRFGACLAAFILSTFLVPTHIVASQRFL